MAGKGPAPKNAATRQRRNKPAQGNLVVLPGGKPTVTKPEPPDHWLPAVVEAWDRYWASAQAQFVTDGTLDTLIRLFNLRNNAARLQATIDRLGDFVEGSQGQDVLNPAHRALASIAPELRQLETLFGLNPDAAARLGLNAIKGEQGLAAYNRELRERALAEARARRADDDEGG